MDILLNYALVALALLGFAVYLKGRQGEIAQKKLAIKSVVAVASFAGLIILGILVIAVFTLLAISSIG